MDDPTPKKLYRSRRDRIIAGVAGGLADYLGWDPTLIRALFVAAVFFRGLGILLYVIFWALVPEERSAPMSEATSPSASEPQVVASEPKRRGGKFGAFLLIALGVFFLLDNFLPHFDIGKFWPLILVAIGAGMLWRRR